MRDTRHLQPIKGRLAIFTVHSDSFIATRRDTTYPRQNINTINPNGWRRRKQQRQALDTAGLLLGVRSGEVFSESEVGFEAGDRLLVYSDGLAEAENRTGVSFGDGKFSVLLAEKQILPVEQFATTLL